MTSTTLETKAAALEGLDFIETEEDVKAVEAATLKIQSTFRGKKIRSKVTSKQPEQAASKQQQEATPSGTEQRRESNKGVKDNELELSSKVAQMQVQDNNGNQMDQQQQKSNSGGGGGGTGAPEEDEAQRAATKIQAGFKGYKTRKELEGKLPSSSGGGGGGGGPQEGAATAQ